MTKVKCPILFIRGEIELGAVMTDDEIAWLKENFSNVHYARINGVGHLCIWRIEVRPGDERDEGISRAYTKIAGTIDALYRIVISICLIYAVKPVLYYASRVSAWMSESV